MNASRPLIAGLVVSGLLGAGCTETTSPPSSAAASVTPSAPAGTPSAAPTAAPLVVSTVALPTRPDLQAPEAEALLRAALRKAGVVDPGIPEDGYKTASMWGPWPAGTALVTVYGELSRAPGMTVLLDRPTTTPPSAVVLSSASGEMVRITCAGLGYDIAVLRGDLATAEGGSTAAAADTLFTALTPHLNC